jgi:hypothetical protein
MSRIVNLKTVRFQIFNALDSWYTNWADDVHYGHLLYEDLGIRSYFSGIFYRLRMPTNYLYLHRMSGNTIMLNTDVYFYKPFKRTKIRKYFTEQRIYINYLLKMYLYLTPYFFRFFDKNSKVSRSKRRTSFFNIIKLHQYNSMGYAGFRRIPFIHNHDDFQSYYKFSTLFSSTFLFSFRLLTKYGSFIRLRSRNRNNSSLLKVFGSVLSRFLYLSFLNGSTFKSFFKFTKYLQFGMPFKYFFFLISTKKNCFVRNTNMFSFFSFNNSQRFIRNSNSRYKGISNDLSLVVLQNSINVNSVYSFYEYLNFCLFYLKKSKFLSFIKGRKLKKKVSDFTERYSKRYFIRLCLKTKALFSLWFGSLLQRFLFSILYKFLLCFSLISLNLKAKKSLYLYLFNCLNVLNFQRSCFSLRLKSNSPSILTIINNRVSFINFFSRLKNLHTYYYRRRKATTNRLFVPKKFKFGHIYTHFLKIFFSYFFNHIENVVSLYTKQNVYCLYNLFYMGTKYYPPILNAKVLCDYFIYLVHGKKSIRGAFYKIRQWQLFNIQRRLSLESMFFKTQMKRNPSTYLNHLSSKKYPVIGIRIECSGNKKKGTMARKFFYGDIVKNLSIVQKNPNNTFKADLDYYQSFALTKSCSVGVKVWVLFKTHLYDQHGSIKTLVVY